MDVSMISELADANVSLEHTRQRLLSEYYPSFHVFGSFYPDLLLVWRRLSDIEGGASLPEPDGAAERRYMSVFYTTVDGAPVQTEWLTNTTVEGSVVYVPDVLAGGNMFQQQMIARNLLSWPLYPGKHYVVDGGNVTSEVWVSSVKDGVADLHVVSYKSGEIFSYARVVYDYALHSDTELVVYTRLSVPPSRVYYLTYKQVRVSGEQYGRLADLLSRKEVGGVSVEEYLREKRGILSA